MIPRLRRTIPRCAMRGMTVAAEAWGMTRDETIALFMECEAKRAEARAAALKEGTTEDEAYNIGHEAAKTNWNNWAETMRAQRKALEVSGTWKTRKTLTDFFPILEPSNPETKIWMEKASCIWSYLHFQPKECHLSEETQHNIIKKVTISSNNLDMSGFVFPWSLDIKFSLFMTDLTLKDCTFCGPILSYEAIFNNSVSFINCLFLEGSIFNGSKFNSRTRYDNSKFLFKNRFDRAIFKRSCRFERAVFVGEAIFDQVNFENFASFRGALFKSAATFDACYALRNFNLYESTFLQVPSFHQAHFVEAPSLASTTFPISKFRGENSTYLRYYRALRRLAIQGHDYEIEAKAFKGEIRSKRGTIDRWYEASFWAGRSRNPFLMRT